MSPQVHLRLIYHQWIQGDEDMEKVAQEISRKKDKSRHKEKSSS